MRQAILMVLNCAVHGSAVEKTVGLLEKELKLAYPDFLIARCYSNSYDINHLREKGIVVKSLDEAMHQLSNSDMEVVIVLPLHMYQDYDYKFFKKQVKKYTNYFETLIVTKPLLENKADYHAFASAIGKYRKSENDINLYIIEREARLTSLCKRITKCFQDNQIFDFFVKAIPDSKKLKDVIKFSKKYNKNTARIFPLKFVPEVHSDLEFNTCFYVVEHLERNEIAVECVLQGLGELPEIRYLYVKKMMPYI